MSHLFSKRQQSGFQGLKSFDFLLHKERVDLAQEFVNAMTNHHIDNSFGVLISGPNGVGKSATGLLTFLVCAAKRLPCIYISSAIKWVFDANANKAANFLLELFVYQNADLIVSDPVLRSVFEPFFRGDEKLDADTMERLQSEFRAHPTLAVGIIIDEVQAITTVAISDENEPSRPYFRDNWYNWQGKGKTFVRMDIATSHGNYFICVAITQKSHCSVKV